MKPYNYVLLALGAALLLATCIFDLSEIPYHFEWIVVVTGGMLCYFGCITKKPRTLKHLGQGLYEHPHPPESSAYLLHNIRDPRDKIEEAIDYLVSIFVSQGAWVGVSIHRLCMDFDEGVYPEIIDTLNEMSRLRLIEKVLVPDADDPKNDKTTVYLVNHQFVDLIIY